MKKNKRRITALIMTAILAAEIMPAYALNEQTGEDDKVNLPVISITGVDNYSAYQEDQTAIITIQEKTEGFDKSRVSINVTKNNEDYNDYTMGGEWKRTEGSTPGNVTHTNTIKFTDEAGYCITVKYDDKKGNKVCEECYFKIDRTKPSGSLGTGLNFDKNITFTNSDFIGHSSSDYGSGLDKSEFYISDSTTIMSETEIENLPEDKWDRNLRRFNDYERCVVYMRVTDNAGNIFYTNTNVIIYDKVAPDINILSPVTVGVKHYEDDVNVKVSVTEQEKDGICSGIAKVTYKLYIDDEVTKEGVIFDFENDDPKEEDLQKAIAGNLKIEAGTLNRDNEVALVAEAWDNAGNKSQKEYILKNTNAAVPKITDTKAQIYTDRVTLSWDKVNTAEGYNVYVDGEKKNDNPITENTYIIKGLKKNTSYKVNVTSIRKRNGSESEKSADISLATGDIVLGDLSGDGKVNIIDAMRIFHYVSGRNKNAEVVKADINGDGKINIIDAMKIIHFVSGRSKEY